MPSSTTPPGESCAAPWRPSPGPWSWIPKYDLSYNDWILIGLAVKGALGDAGLGVFAEWSARSSKDVAATTLKAWRSLKPHSRGAGTIYGFARDYGWVPDHDMILNGGLADAVASVDFSGLMLQAPRAPEPQSIPRPEPEIDPETEIEPEPEPTATLQTRRTSLPRPAGSWASWSIGWWQQPAIRNRCWRWALRSPPAAP